MFKNRQEKFMTQSPARLIKKNHPCRDSLGKESIVAASAELSIPSRV